MQQPAKNLAASAPRMEHFQPSRGWCLFKKNVASTSTVPFLEYPPVDLRRDLCTSSNMALAQTSQDSPLTPTPESPEFPSGSKWGIAQLENLAFPLEPQVHDFADLRCGRDISTESSNVIDRLRIGFGIEETEWGDDNLPIGYKQFYDDLADMLPQIKARQHTPRKLATRSNTKLPSSSIAPSSSPWSVGNTKRSAPISSRSTPSKAPFPAVITRSPGNYEDDQDISPAHAPKRRRQSSPSTPSPSLPGRQTTPLTLKQVTTSVPHDWGLTSSQSDSTFQASEADNSASESERSDGDRPEIDVSSVIRSLLVRICREHKDSNGYKFTAGYDADTLTVPICGDFAKTTPDLILRLEQAGKKFPILDFEARIS
ncbi:hypothetical protein BDZ45DRAFT_302913 [Acephala macrosclerotiorum]|nr:hypothetical protein BDZ45DRAFT_302913 [Acephala macrosclerotiorum]